MSISTSVLCDPPDSSAPLAVLVVGERDTKPDPSALVDASTCSVCARTWDMAIDLRLRCIPQATRLAMDSTPRVCAFGGTSKRKDCPRCPEFGSSLAVAIIGPELGLENPDKKWRRGGNRSSSRVAGGCGWSAAIYSACANSTPMISRMPSNYPQ
jgi:hypothetical protein